MIMVFKMDEDLGNGCAMRKCKAETLGYLTVQVLLVAVIFVPTVFFIMQPVHKYHTNGYVPAFVVGERLLLGGCTSEKLRTTSS